MLFMVMVLLTACPALSDQVTVARLHYGGGGEWYWGPSSLPNLLAFVRENTGVDAAEEEVSVALDDDRVFEYPFLYATGHGDFRLTEEETARLREYCLRGGFFFVNDSYGLRPDFEREIERTFPDRELVELPHDHPIYHTVFDFPNGLPKIHKHDGLAPQGLAIVDDEGRVMVFFAYESDIGDGWEDPDVHNDPPEIRTTALQMGANIFVYALTH
jgi:hypothetical protein